MMPSVVMYAYFREDGGRVTKGRAQTVGETDIEKHLAIKEQARQYRRARRSRSVTQLSSETLPLLGSDLRQDGLEGFAVRNGRRQTTRVHRVRSVPAMVGGF